MSKKDTGRDRYESRDGRVHGKRSDGLRAENTIDDGDRDDVAVEKAEKAEKDTKDEK